MAIKCEISVPTGVGKEVQKEVYDYPDEVGFGVSTSTDLRYVHEAAEIHTRKRKDWVGGVDGRPENAVGFSYAAPEKGKAQPIFSAEVKDKTEKSANGKATLPVTELRVPALKAGVTIPVSA